jgi:hypothetical protein
MDTAFLFATVCVLLIYMGWRDINDRKDRRALINRIIGRTPTEVRALDAEPPKQQPVPAVPEDWREFLEHGEPIGM